MAARFGKDGYISFDSSSGGGTANKPTYIDSWALTAKMSLTEVTAFGDKWKKFAPTVREWSVTASGNLDKGSTDQQGAVLLPLLDSSTSYNSTVYPMRSVYLRLYESTAYWAGMAKLAEFKVGSQVGSNVSVTYTLQGTSALNYITT